MSTLRRSARTQQTDIGWSHGCVAGALNVEHPERNPFPPDKFESAVRAALKYADEYVWVYSETPRWWSEGGGPTNLPPSYAAAIRQAASMPASLPAPADHAR